MNRIHLVLCSLVLFGASIELCNAQGTTAIEPKKRNVLFLISDDLNNLLGCYGDRQARTPNIDALAARGVLFQKAYCTFPLCGPSRNSMLTGLYPNSTGIVQNQQIFRQTIPNQKSLPQLLRLQGYFAARVGKLYHYNVPRSIGTNGHDDPGSWELEVNPAGVDRLEEEPMITSLTPGEFGGSLSWYASPKSDSFHTDAMMAEDAEWILERCAKRKDRPFFLAVGFYRPHTPYVAPKDPYFGYHPKSAMRLVQGVAEDQADLPKPALGSHKKDQEKLDDDLRQQALQAYYASISFMDAQVGRVVAALDRLGLAETTTIVFTSDNGYHTGEHGLWQKMSLFEESARVPLLIVAPGVAKAGGIAESPVSQLDLVPTLLDLCNVSPPSNIQGQNLVPMLKDPQTVGRGWALTQVSRTDASRASPRARAANDVPGFYGYSLRTARWRFTEWDEGKEGRELYDHDNDPKELKNLANDSAHSKTMEQLSTQLRAAVAKSFPESGKMPEVKQVTWHPNLTNP